MDYHHVVEAAGIVSLGLVLYSYLLRVLDGAPATWRRWRPLLTGVAFGAVAIALMIARIYVGHDRFVDARAVPIALVTLIEGIEAGAVATALAVLYRLWQGGSGAPAGVLGLVATAAVGVAVRRWARRDGGLRRRHVVALIVAVWAITAASFLMLGARGFTMFEPLWLDFLALSVIGIGAGARLFGDVVNGHAAEAARRDAAQLRAVASLARAAAHEINNPLTVIVGSLELLQRRLTAEGQESRWIDRAVDAAQRIRDIIGRMTNITRVQASGDFPGVPAMLDIHRSSEDNAKRR
jgi:signal transduction histidine kinase